MSIHNTKADKMRYQTNRTSYLLVMLSIVMTLIALFTNINYDQFISVLTDEHVYYVQPDLRVGLEIGLGIIMMLVMFMAAEKIKYYDGFWSRIGLFVLAGINIVRAFNLPLYALNQEWIPFGNVLVIMIEYGVAGLLLIYAGFISLQKYHILRAHLKELNINGNDAV